ncbi:hypothetical protein [Cellulosimicrobium cellulans]|uniref:hypothetical protein n=1 Tax=Cellulosimicrobium cellulans TaxID=1710 RepID=UPI003825F611
MTLPTRATAAVLAVLALAGTAGCGTANEPEPQGGDAGAMVAAAEDQGADSRQVEALADGDVTYEEYEAAFGRYFACVEEVGSRVEDKQVVTQEGIKQLRYVVATPDGASVDLATACYGTHAQAIDMYWQTENPDLVAYRERRAAALRPLLVECLEDAGAGPGDATYEEMVDDVLGRGVDGRPGADCLATVGHETWEG